MFCKVSTCFGIHPFSRLGTLRRLQDILFFPSGILRNFSSLLCISPASLSLDEPEHLLYNTFNTNK